MTDIKKSGDQAVFVTNGYEGGTKGRVVQAGVCVARRGSKL